MPNGTYQGEYGWPELSLSEYEKLLILYLSMLREQGIKTQEEVDAILTEAMTKATYAGRVTPDMPLYREIIQPRLPMFISEQKQRQAEGQADIWQRFAEPGAKAPDTGRAPQAGETKRQGLQQERQAFETWQAGQLAQLTGDYNWINRWEVENIQGPWVGPGGRTWEAQSPEERGATLTLGGPTGSMFGVGTGERLGRGYPDIQNYWGAIREAVASRQPMAEGPYPATPMTRQEAYAERAKMGGGPPEKAPPPAAPGWLAKLVPGLVTGEPIRQKAIPTPSPQQWAALPPSQQAMYAGYADWAGGRPYEDIMWHMKSMLPREPAGIRSKRWTPARQVA